MDSIATGGGDGLRDAGITSVLEHAGGEWGDRYTYIAYAWFYSLPVNHLFIGEDLRFAVREGGLQNPPHPNAWGARASSVLKKWKKAGLIEDVGMCKAKADKAHSRLYPQYKKTRQLNLAK